MTFPEHHTVTFPEHHTVTSFEFRRTMPAALPGVEALSLEVRKQLAGSCSDADVFASELLLREALTNAALHGCGLNEGMEVGVVIRRRRNRIVFAVRDAGCGFDWRKRLGHLSQADETSGRGLAIYKAYADLIRFNRAGNAVTLVRRFSPGDRAQRDRQVH